MNEEQFFNADLEARLLKLEEEFKEYNPLGYQQRSNLIKNIFYKSNFILHEMLSCEKDNHFITYIDKFGWVLKLMQKKTYSVFHEDDIIRLQYIDAAKNGNFIGYLPQKIILEDIRDEDTLKMLSPISNEDLVKLFLFTPIGQKMHYSFNNFRLGIKKISFKKNDNDTLNKKTIIIETDMLPN